MARSEDLRTEESRGFHQRVMHSSLSERDSLLGSRASTWSPGRSDARPMVEREVMDLASRPGHDVGAHTVNHLYLPRQDASVISQELLESRRRLESMLRRPIQALAYPFGGVDHTVRQVAGDSGFACAVTVESRLVRGRGMTLFCCRASPCHPACANSSGSCRTNSPRTRSDSHERDRAGPQRRAPSQLAPRDLTKQSLSESWETVAVDNGSSDGSVAILERYKDRLPLTVIDASPKGTTLLSRGTPARGLRAVDSCFSWTPTMRSRLDMSST